MSDNKVADTFEMAGSQFCIHFTKLKQFHAHINVLGGVITNGFDIKPARHLPLLDFTI